jgi:peptidoglycan/LPS O-acetylase OafA/YrhL
MALVVAVFARGGGHLSRLLAARPLVFLGEASYSLYMVHCIVMAHLFHRRADLGLDGWHLAAVGIAAAVGVAVACYLLVEDPARRWLTRWLRPKVVVVPDVAPRLAA